MVLARKNISPELEKSYEIPSLYDIIVKHDFKREDIPKVDFLLYAHQCRLENREVDFQSQMMKLCERPKKK